jgi:hypothetical protein
MVHHRGEASVLEVHARCLFTLRLATFVSEYMMRRFLRDLVSPSSCGR